MSDYKYKITTPEFLLNLIENDADNLDLNSEEVFIYINKYLCYEQDEERDVERLIDIICKKSVKQVLFYINNFILEFEDTGIQNLYNKILYEYKIYLIDKKKLN